MSTEYILEGNKSKKFGSPSHKFNSKEGNKILKRKKETKQENLPQRAVFDGTTCKSSKVVSYQP